MGSVECQGVGKSAWPELVGTKGKEAAATIERENPNVHAEIVLIGTYILPVLVCTRVRVWVDTNGIVIKVPFAG